MVEIVTTITEIDRSRLYRTSPWRYRQGLCVVFTLALPLMTGDKNKKPRWPCLLSCALLGCLSMILIPAIAIGIALLRRDPPPTFTSEPVTVTGGQILGTVKDGIRSYKGIPFAAPPVGSNRWRSPQPVEAWTGVRKADTFGPAPMQNKGVVMLFSGKLDVKISEDCLYLNVWTPAKHPKEKLPVMVWIYGGGFNSGLTSSPLYDGANLAKRGVIVVSIAYRVGPFGFLAHPELNREGGKGSGTYGLQDMVAGLRWVKGNIAQFGGDAGNVTLFGESAGGGAISMLAAAPAARGLFHKAIAESGTPFGQYGAEQEQRSKGEKTGESFLARLGVKDIKAARALSAEAIQKSAEGLGAFAFGAVPDGEYLVADAYQRYQQGKFNDTPILVGTNSDDGAMFTPPGITLTKYKELARGLFKENTDSVLAAYSATTDTEAARAARHIVRDTAFAWGTWTWARLQSLKGKNAAYLYYFDWRVPKSAEGAGHGAEIPYVFGNLNPLFGQGTPQARSLSETMQGYWINFAKTGNPNGPGLPVWPAYREPDAKALIFQDVVRAEAVPNLAQLKAINTHYGKR